MISTETQQALQSKEEDVRLRAILELAPPQENDDAQFLVEMLGDESWRVRKSVVRLLAQTEIELVVPLLMKTLTQRHIGPRHIRFQNSALECLAEIGQPAIPALSNALQDRDKDVRIVTANALGTIRHPDACDALIRALQDEHVNVRYAAVEALSRIPSQKSVIPLTQILEYDEDWLKLPAIAALGHIGDYRATPYLTKISEHPLYMQTVIEALGNIGDERGIPAIIQALNSTDKEIRKTATMSMESMARKLDKRHAIIQQPSTYRALFRAACTEQIMLHLVELMDDQDFGLVLSAVKLLGWSGRKDAAYALLEKLDHEQLLEAVVSALIEIGEEAILPLSNAYDASRSLERKLLLIDCLREIGGEKTFVLFLKYLKQATEEFIIYALLKSLSKEPFLSRVLVNRAQADSSQYAFVLQQAQQHADSSHPLIRAEAIYLLGFLLGLDALDVLINATKDVEPTIRLKAIEHLGRLVNDAPSLLEHLIFLLSDDHPNIRKQVACALGHALDPSAFPALLLLLEDVNAHVQRAAVNGVGLYLSTHPEPMYRDRVLDKLRDVLETRCRRYEDGLLKIELCQTLQRIQTSASRDLLIKLTSDFDFDVRKSAITALGFFQSDASELIPILSKFLSDVHWSVREAAVAALGILDAYDAEAILLQMRDDPDLAVRKALFVTLGRIGSPDIIPVLLTALAHDELDYAAYQGLCLMASRHTDALRAYEFHENPKVQLYLKHILGTLTPD
ncbi:Alr1903 protein [Candidatus Moduliflexus flocculans]|uniref:Alr1903 protein n=1 Tax=Candidatus Moduliflexus flocculans TaxID=1499966 RepID=A0A0S6VWG4_9BACT|nr:Alr1903 protein [Candidatus Moduliflexus flocculans]